MPGSVTVVVERAPEAGIAQTELGVLEAGRQAMRSYEEVALMGLFLQDRPPGSPCSACRRSAKGHVCLGHLVRHVWS